MRVFRYISMFVLSIWFLSITANNWLPRLILFNNEYFNNQLFDVEKIDKEKLIIVYGSSGLLLGISAESLEFETGHPARNLSTAALGGLIELAISRITPHIKKGDIVIVGDRLYRKSHRDSFSPREFLNEINKLVSFNPRLRSYLLTISPISRTAYGDYINYSKLNLAAETYDINPNYTNSNIELMKRHIDLIKKSGGCPLLVFVPVLVKPEERVNFEAATERLMSMAKSADILDYILRIPSIEDDVSLFVNQNHLSEKGRAKWTSNISKEILAKNLCGIGF